MELLQELAELRAIRRHDVEQLAEVAEVPTRILPILQNNISLICDLPEHLHLWMQYVVVHYRCIQKASSISHAVDDLKELRGRSTQRRETLQVGMALLSTRGSKAPLHCLQNWSLAIWARLLNGCEVG